MEIEHLREFAILARHLNFREAAADLHISQSALSRHIAALEQFYGTALFKRDRHAVYLTDAGAFLLDYAEQLWEQFSLSREHLQRLFSGERHLRISGIVGHPSFYPCILNAETRLRAADPTVTLRVERNTSASLLEQVEALQSDETDCALLLSSVASTRESYENMESIRLGHVPVSLIVRRDHPLAHEPLLTADALQNGRFVHFTGPDFSPYWHVFSQLLDEAEITYTTAPYPANSEYDIIRAIDAMGTDLYLSPRTSILPAIAQNPDAAIIPLVGEELTLDLDLLYRPGHKEDLVRLVAPCLKGAFAAFNATL